MADMSLSMKLLVDSNGRRVLFAEAGKEVVDFLFSMLALPLGAHASIQIPEDMVGSIGNLYQSMEDLRDLSMIPNKKIDFLERPAVVTTTTNSGSPLWLLSTGKSPSPPKKSYYKCSNTGYNTRCREYLTLDPKCRCPYCSATMSSPLTLVCPTNEESSSSSFSSSSIESGFVKGCVTYMIMDDLVVKPMSTISSITLFNKLNLKDVGALEEKTVNLTFDKCQDLVRASLQTKKVLTKVFFKEKMAVKEEKSLESVD